MSDAFQFQPFKPKVKSRIQIKRTCCVCGSELPATEMVYVGPITEISRDPARFKCKDKHDE